MNKKKKIIIGIIVLVSIIVITLGVTYAYWQFIRKQEGENVVKSACLDISISDEANQISLQKAMPISDVEATQLKPFTFTVTNNCQSSTNYSIRLESLEKTTLDSKHVKTMLNEVNKPGKPKIYGDYEEIGTTIAKAKESRILEEGTLTGGESKKYELRLWLDANAEEDAMNKSFQSKIVVNSYIGVLPNNPLAVDYLEELQAERPEELAYDDTGDANLRFIGATPKNYVLFNCEQDVEPSKETCETWRIIGAMNNIIEVSEDGLQTETTGSHLKIIRDKFDTNYSWDSSASGVNEGYGVNEWSQAALEKVLNNEYLNRRTGSNLCYKNYNNTTETCPDWPNIGIRESSRNMIASVKWNTGTMSVAYNNNENLLTAKYMYEAEQSDHNGKEQCSGGYYCNDAVERTTTWTGKVGLMYPSDYGYAVGTEVRETCLGKSMYTYDKDNCKTNDWLYDLSNKQWTITPASYSINAESVFYVDSSGYVGCNASLNAYAVRPTVYLKSDVEIVQNNDDDYGSIDNPFVLEM